MSPSITDLTTQLTVPAFSPSLGALQSVQVTFTDNGNFSGTVKNTSSTPQNFTVYEESDISLNGPGVNLGNTHSMTALSVVATQKYSNLATNTASPFGTMTASGGSGPVTISSGPSLASYFSGTTVSFTLATLTSVTIDGGGGNIQTRIATLAGATLSVQYNFTPTSVPEPASFAMLGLGLIGIFAYRMLRRNRLSIEA